jgi:hypothetical protein
MVQYLQEKTARKTAQHGKCLSLLAKVDYDQYRALQVLVVVHPLVGQPTVDG